MQKNKLKKALLYATLATSVVGLTSCNAHIPGSGSNSGTTTEVNQEIHKIYDLYYSNGGTLTYDEWLAMIKGEKGDKGDKGDKGETGANGLSAYEIYKKYHPEYQGSENDWINDLINNKLGISSGYDRW